MQPRYRPLDELGEAPPAAPPSAARSAEAAATEPSPPSTSLEERRLAWFRLRKEIERYRQRQGTEGSGEGR